MFLVKKEDGLNLVEQVTRAITSLFLSLSRVEIVGLEVLAKQGPVIVCANHISWVDPFLIKCLIITALPGRKVGGWAKKELFSFPPFAWYMRQMRTFPIDRTKQTDKAAFKWFLQALEEGYVVGIFPQGTRHGQTIKGGVYPFARSKRKYKQPNGVSLPSQLIVVTLHYTSHRFGLMPCTQIIFEEVDVDQFPDESVFHSFLQKRWGLIDADK